VDPEMEIIKGKKVKATTSRKRKNKDKNLVGRPTPEDGEVDLEEQNGELMVTGVDSVNKIFLTNHVHDFGLFKKN
jgi:hypothetical protein